MRNIQSSLLKFNSINKYSHSIISIIHFLINKISNIILISSYTEILFTKIFFAERQTTLQSIHYKKKRAANLKPDRQWEGCKATPFAREVSAIVSRRPSITRTTPHGDPTTTCSVRRKPRFRCVVAVVVVLVVVRFVLCKVRC